MELRRRLMSYGRSPSRNGQKISIPSRDGSEEVVKSPRFGPFSPGSSPRKSLKNLFVRKKSRRESSPDTTSPVKTPSRARQSMDEVRELTEVFGHFDADGDGKISAVELRSVFLSLGEDLSEKELTAMIEEVDSDGDGYINLTDFIRLNSGILAGFDADTELRDAFRLFDVDKEGHITAKGLHEIFTRLGEESTIDDCHLMIKRVDSDGDGVVNFREFKQMMMA